jgi:uncharacterized protein
MRMTLRGTIGTLLVVALAGAASLFLPLVIKAKAVVPPEVAAMHFAPYEPQRVIYHVTDGEWFFERKFKNMLHVARNHVDAVALGELDLRIVLQGGGMDLLLKAKSDAKLASEIDLLRKAGVTFVVCRNTLVLRGLDPAALHMVKREDIVASSVAEAAALVGKGYVYMKF